MPLSLLPRSESILKLLAIATIAGIFLVPVAQASSKLSANELREQIVGKKLEFETPNGAHGFVRYSNNGKAKLWDSNFDPNRDRGKWWIEGNTLCNQWKVVRNGTASCSSFKSIGNGSYMTSRGTKVWVN